MLQFAPAKTVAAIPAILDKTFVSIDSSDGKDDADELIEMNPELDRSV
jgi:hypothetical protein